MTIPSKYRGITAIALQRLSEREIRSLHQEISGMSPGAFLDLVRDIEDEIENSIGLTLHRAREGHAFSHRNESLFQELDSLRKHLRVPVYKFADLLAESISEVENIKLSEVPAFDSRRGIQAWINKLVKVFPEQLIFHAALKLDDKFRSGRDSEWKLR